MNRFFWKRLIGSLGVAFLSLQLTRLLFYLNLRSYFEADAIELLHAFLIGFEFDMVTIAYLLGPFFLALPFLKGGKPELLAKWFFLIMLAAMNLLNCIDAEFFKFTARRSTDDLFEFAFLSDDIFNIAPNLVGHFWYLIVVFGIISLLTLAAMNKILERNSGESKLKMIHGLNLLPVIALLVIFSRGGFHPIPLSIIDASKVSPPHLNSIALSTPFTIIKTLGKPELPVFEFDENEIADLDPIVYPDAVIDSTSLKGSNVVLLIVESLSTEYVGSLNGLGVTYTPFLDSLFQHSLVFENGHANGHRSIEGIASIAASIPTLMYEPYTTSRYAENNINSLPSLLRKNGYHSSFMHGGNKNSMNFESFSSQADYDLFYDRDDYPFPDKHYDGVWGISDHYMLAQCIEEYNKYPKPFFSTIFTLSSHHPYTIPEDYQNRFPKGTLPIHESIGYADQSLREFFQKASKTEWYQNTLFVITADHTSLSEHDQFQTKDGSLRIPIVFFHPNDSILTGSTSKLVQQIDIMPTILDLLDFESPYFAFGKSAFDTTNSGFSIAFKHDQYQLLRNDQLICFDGNKVSIIYDVVSDPMLHYNLIEDSAVNYADNEAFLKGYIQNYSVALNHNSMTFEAWSEMQK
ncbi:MAG: sulfatase-like hydrolase/transferase [Flavobacteriales bacterium]|nr:sulfatase-like hydrolase/transferase [Flavobacteriales bacterium]